MPGMEAGKGEHRVYRIVDPVPGDTARLTAGNHYVGVDAVAWFINKESNWFADRMASGTLTLSSLAASRLTKRLWARST